MPFRFLHVADVHLDSPFCSRSAETRRALRDAARDAFRACIETAIQERVHALLIAGDLFDKPSLSFATEKLLLQEFARLREHNVRVFYAPGNHDPYGSGFRASELSWPDNVVVFNSWKPATHEVLEDGRCIALVTGAGHENPAEERNLASLFPLARPGIPHVAVLHTLVEGASGCEQHQKYAACSRSDLEAKGYAYWALGHVHARSENWSDTVWVYPGSLVGKNRRETGIRGGYLVEIDDLGGVRAVFRAMSPLAWCTVTANQLQHVRDFDSLVTAIVKEVERELAGNGTPESVILTIQLEGACPLYRELRDEDNLAQLAEDIAARLDIDSVEVNADRVLPPVRLDTYANAPSLLGEFIRLVERARTDDQLLLELAPEPLAGLKSTDQSERIAYLRSLLSDLEIEGIARLVEGVTDALS